MWIVLTILFIATLIRSSLGFGEALVAVPLLALLVPIQVAVPLAVLVSITVAGVVVLQDWRHVHARSAGRLVLATLLGTPIGILTLTHAPETLIKATLGAVILGFAAYCLIHRRPGTLKDDRWAWGFGFIAGVLGGAYGINGPPLAVYGSLRGWSPAQFRATLQGYFLPASTAGLIGYWIAGLWVPQVTHLYLLALGPVMVAILIGRSINRRLRHGTFAVYVHLGLLITGLLLVLQTLWPGSVSIHL